MIDSPELLELLGRMRLQAAFMGALAAGILLWGVAGALRVWRDYLDELRVRQLAGHLGRVTLSLAACCLVASLTVAPHFHRALAIAGQGDDRWARLLKLFFLPVAWPEGTGWAPLGLLLGSLALVVAQGSVEGRRAMRWHLSLTTIWLLVSAAGLLALVVRAWMAYPTLMALVRK